MLDRKIQYRCPKCDSPVFDEPTIDPDIRQTKHCRSIWFFKNGRPLNPLPMELSQERMSAQ